MLIVHLTSVHPPHDTRIFHKMCKSLVSDGYDVNLVFAMGDGETKSIVDNVILLGVPSSPKNRLHRMIFVTWRVYLKSVSLKADVYHFHDPELIFLGLLLKLLGKHVIYDVHEDYAAAILDREYLPTWIKPILGSLIRILEQLVARMFDGIVAATPKIGQQFRNGNTVIIQNFPALNNPGVAEETIEPQPLEQFKLVYVGSISKERGLFEMLDVLPLVNVSFNVQLILVGDFSPKNLESLARQNPGWCLVNYTGWIPQTRVVHILANSAAGLVLFHPRPNHLEAQPNKLFEYMQAGIPVIASDFPLWREIVQESRCGIVVDPLNRKEIANSIEWLIEHPKEAEEMGRRGRRAVIEKYNWDNEFKKLVKFYEDIMETTDA